MKCDQALLQRDKKALSEYSKNNLTTISGERRIKNKSLQTLKKKKCRYKNIKEKSNFNIHTNYVLKLVLRKKDLNFRMQIIIQ